jgi:(p)ppGpp synthase/HD superfamily hydrolase
MLTARFNSAFQFAEKLHARQLRNGTKIPYISHLMIVSGFVLENGGDEDQAIAALLHDAVEDQGGAAILAEIEARFGEDVAGIVADCTDSLDAHISDWRMRKERYLATLRSKVPARSLLVSLADKTHNAEAIRADYKLHGEALWQRFSGNAAGTRWYYRSLVALFQERMPGPLTERLAAAVADFAASPNPPKTC